MFGLVLALAPVLWPHRLTVFLLIVILTFFTVFVRARRARRRAGLFPIGSLVFCICLLIGFVLGEVRSPFHILGWTAYGLICGAVAGGLTGVVRALPGPEEVTKHKADVSIRDEDFDW